MWKLTIEDDEGQRTSLELGQPLYSIGRGPESTIRLTERNVSRRHIVLRFQDPVWTIEDSGSYNGTYVSGERLGGVRQLKSGDVIQLADYRIEISDQAVAVAAPAEPVPAEQRRPDRLIVVIGPQPGREYPLRGERLGVGRAEEATISINHASVSRMHAEIVALGQGRYEVVDQGSANGIRINGQELRRGIIEPGDALELGDVRLRFIGAGKWLRPSADLSAHLPLEAFAGDAATKTAKRGGKIAAAMLVVLGAVGVGVWLMVRSSVAGPAGTVSAEVEDPCQSPILTEAMGLTGSDVDEAHKRVLLEVTSLGECPAFVTVETKWGESMLARAAAAESDPEKVKIAEQINQTITVPREIRVKARELITSLGFEPVAVQEPPPKATAAGTTTYRPPPTNTGALPLPPTTTAAKTTSSPATSTTSPGNTSDITNTKAQLASLQAKVWGGRGSCDDIRMLRALCMQPSTKDTACRDRATSLFKSQGCH